MKKLLLKFGFWQFQKKKTYCPVCNKTNAGFRALPDYYRDNAIKHGYRHFGKGEMTALETYSCINCGASDRERIYAYWIASQLEKKKISSNTRIIHFAPEAALSEKLKTLNFKSYHTADIFMDGCDCKIDMMNIPFRDKSYDFFICSHVLEHVESDDTVISELNRITKENGWGILMVPVVIGLEKTLEDPSIKNDFDRWQLYGQNDHVRLYAHDDYVSKIRSHGFKVREFGVKYFGKKILRLLGLKYTSILYVVTK